MTNLMKRVVLARHIAGVPTAADFRLDDDTSGIGALLEAVANQHHFNVVLSKHFHLRDLLLRSGRRHVYFALYPEQLARIRYTLGMVSGTGTHHSPLAFFISQS